MTPDLLSKFEGDKFIDLRKKFIESYSSGGKEDDLVKLDFDSLPINKISPKFEKCDNLETLKEDEITFESAPFFENGITPEVNFSKYLLANLEKGIILKLHSQKGYLKFPAKNGLTLEPVIVEFESDSILLLNFSGEADSVCLDFIRVFVKENVKAKMFLLFENGKRGIDFSSKLENGSTLEVYPIVLKGEQIFFNSNHTIVAKDAMYVERSASLIKGKDRLKQITLVNENEERVKVEVEARSILDGSSRCLIKGILNVEKKAKKSESHYGGHCLKFSNESKAVVEPQLEIKSLDVKATHSASVSKVDDEKVFYLESRGLKKERARKEIGVGFLSSFVKGNQFLEKKIEENFDE